MRVFRLKGLEVANDERLALRCGRLLDEGLRHPRALACGTGVTNVAGHRQRHAADHGDPPSEPSHAVGDLRKFGSDAVGQQCLCPGVLGLEQLRRHIDVLDVELLVCHRLDALGGERFQKIGATQLAAVRRICKDGRFPESSTRDRLLDDHRRLDAVGRRVAKDVVVRLVVELMRDGGAGGHVVHHWNLRFLIELLRRQGDAGVGIAYRGGHFVPVDELAGNLHATLTFGFVIALDHEQRATQHAPRLIDLIDGQAHAVAHAHASEEDPPVNGPVTPMRMGSAADAAPAPQVTTRL